MNLPPLPPLPPSKGRGRRHLGVDVEGYEQCVVNPSTARKWRVTIELQQDAE